MFVMFVISVMSAPGTHGRPERVQFLRHHQPRRRVYRPLRPRHRIKGRRRDPSRRYEGDQLCHPRYRHWPRDQWYRCGAGGGRWRRALRRAESSGLSHLRHGTQSSTPRTCRGLRVLK